MSRDVNGFRLVLNPFSLIPLFAGWQIQMATMSEAGRSGTEVNWSEG